MKKFWKLWLAMVISHILIQSLSKFRGSLLTFWKPFYLKGGNLGLKYSVCGGKWITANWPSQLSWEAKKHDYDATLTEFLGSLMDYNPTVNFSFHCLEHLISSSMIGGSVLVMLFQILDDLVDHYLAKSGFQCPDEGLVGISLQFYFILILWVLGISWAMGKVSSVKMLFCLLLPLLNAEFLLIHYHNGSRFWNLLLHIIVDKDHHYPRKCLCLLLKTCNESSRNWKRES